MAEKLSTMASQSTFIGGVYKIGGKLDVHAFAAKVTGILEHFR
jgi:hypothetical protein